MQQPKEIIQLSDHVKNKIKSHRITPVSFSSDELILSDDNDSSVFQSPEKSFRRRSLTFITYQIPQPSEPFFTDQRIKSPQTQLCQECLHRDHLLQNEHQRLLHIHEENGKLSHQLRSVVLLNHQYQEENLRLKQHLTQITLHPRESQKNFHILKQKMISPPSKPDLQINQLNRLRHELHVYHQVIADKRKEAEQKQIGYFSYLKKK